jgi:hypothetical protein
MANELRTRPRMARPRDRPSHGEDLGVTPGSEQQRQAKALILMDREVHGCDAALLSILARSRSLAEEGNL